MILNTSIDRPSGNLFSYPVRLRICVPTGAATPAGVGFVYVPGPQVSVPAAPRPGANVPQVSVPAAPQPGANGWHPSGMQIPDPGGIATISPGLSAAIPRDTRPQKIPHPSGVPAARHNRKHFPFSNGPHGLDPKRMNSFDPGGIVTISPGLSEAIPRGHGDPRPQIDSHPGGVSARPIP